MDRRRFLLASLAGSVAALLAACAQEAGQVARIGVLGANREAFLQGLRDLGYVEGRNVVIEYRLDGGKPERLPALAAELVGSRLTSS